MILDGCTAAVVAQISCGIYAHKNASNARRKLINKDLKAIVQECLQEPPGTCGGSGGMSGVHRGSLMPGNTHRGSFFSTVIIGGITPTRAAANTLPPPAHAHWNAFGGAAVASWQQPGLTESERQRRWEAEKDRLEGYNPNGAAAIPLSSWEQPGLTESERQRRWEAEKDRLEGYNPNGAAAIPMPWQQPPAGNMNTVFMGGAWHGLPSLRAEAQGRPRRMTSASNV